MDPEVTGQLVGVGPRKPNIHDPESLASIEKIPGTHGGDPVARDIGSGNSALGEPKATTEQVPPDGGLQAWLCVLGAFLCQFSSFGFLNAYVSNPWARVTPH